MPARPLRCAACAKPTWTRTWCTRRGVACSPECAAVIRAQIEEELIDEIEAALQRDDKDYLITGVDFGHNVSFDLAAMSVQAAQQRDTVTKKLMQLMSKQLADDMVGLSLSTVHDSIVLTTKEPYGPPSRKSPRLGSEDAPRSFTVCDSAVRRLPDHGVDEREGEPSAALRCEQAAEAWLAHLRRGEESPVPELRTQEDVVAASRRAFCPDRDRWSYRDE